MRNITLILVLLCSTMIASAQTQEAKWGLGVYPSSLSFYALDSSAVFEASNYEPGVRFSIARYLNASFDFGIEGAFAVVRHPATEANNNNQKLARDNFYDGDAFLKYKLNNGYFFGKKSFFAPFLKAGIGQNRHAADSLSGTFAPLGAGLSIKLNKSAYLTAESNFKYGVNNSVNYLHHSIGVNINLGTTGRKINLRKRPTDTDGDGVPDFTDKCPNLEGDALTGGCPDADNDGILDSMDKCPNTKGYANLGGCLDRDNDGISDVDDKCPDSFGEADSGGCPTGGGTISVANDADGDKIPDELDRCPNTKGTFTATGCPDDDGDGIPNKEDSCPSEYGKVQYKGCPYDATGMERLTKGFDPNKAPERKVVTKNAVLSSTNSMMNSSFDLSVTSVSRSTIVPTEFDYCAYFDEYKSEFEQGILFGSGSANLNASTKKVLNRLAKFIKKCGQRSVVIKAHTDNVGDETNNQKLSERRAEAVKKYLIQKGADSNLLEAVGYGSIQPIAPNDTSENKAKNRRVELEIR